LNILKIQKREKYILEGLKDLLMIFYL